MAKGPKNTAFESNSSLVFLFKKQGSWQFEKIHLARIFSKDWRISLLLGPSASLTTDDDAYESGGGSSGSGAIKKKGGGES